MKKTSSCDNQKVLIGERLKIIMMAREMTTGELAKLVGMPQQSVSLWRQGRQITTANLIKVCTALEVTPNTLLGYDDEFETYIRMMEKLKAYKK